MVEMDEIDEIDAPLRKLKPMNRPKSLIILIALLALLSTRSFCQSRVTDPKGGQPGSSQISPGPTGSDEINTLNQALAKRAAVRTDASSAVSDYVIGANDLVEISVFDIKDLDRVVRVSNQGRISLPLIGSVQASGLTSHELEIVIAELLRQKYVKNPQVSVFIKEFQSRPVAIYGAVKNPGIIQLQSPRTLIELLAMTGGFSDDVGDYVTVRRHAALAYVAAVSSNKSPEGNGENADAGSIPAESTTGTSAPQLSDAANTAASARKMLPENSGASDAGSTKAEAFGPPTAPQPSTFTGSSEQDDIIKIMISDLISSSDPKYNLMIEPGDAINVAKAGVVYVTGDVGRPGGFVLKERESLSVLQAVSLAEGVHSTAAKSATRIIRKHSDGKKEEIPVDLGKIFEGKAPDLPLQNNDVLFIPASAGKTAFKRSAEAALQIATGVIIYRR
jgi:protein involved in polysaccharide export with SLBB domain